MQNKRIIVVNHDDVYLQLVHDLLSDESYTNVSCIQTAGAYQILLYDHPDLIILDVPVVTTQDSWTLLDLLRLDPRLRTIPLILCSTDAKLLVEKRAFLQGRGCDTLEKPFLFDELLAKIQHALGERSFSQSYSIPAASAQPQSAMGQ
jgi:DNA-binding response OmpR family regulator